MLKILFKMLIWFSIAICAFGFFSVFIVPDNHAITSMFYVGLIAWNMLGWLSKKFETDIDMP